MKFPFRGAESSKAYCSEVCARDLQCDCLLILSILLERRLKGSKVLYKQPYSFEYLKSGYN